MKKQITFENDLQVLIENEDILSKHYFSFCPIGWSQLLRQLFRDIRHVCETQKSALPIVLQVKSKFGGLRFYLDHGYYQLLKNSTAEIEIRRLIEEAEKRSYSLCEITGQPGSLYIKNNYFATLSDKMAKELGFTRRD